MPELLDKIFANSKTTDKILQYEGIEIPVTVRELSWMEKTKILEETVVFENNKQKFLIGTYFREILKKIIVKAPWGKTDEIFFSRLSDSFGTVLQSLVPKPGGAELDGFLESEPDKSLETK
jgi:hypothetical protein